MKAHYWAHAFSLALAARVAASSSCAAHGHTKLVDNFRNVQAVGDRVVYRSPAATATCPDEAVGTEPQTPTRRVRDTTTRQHWSYADQAHWGSFGSHRLDHGEGSAVTEFSKVVVNECASTSSEGGSPTHPGQSPINIDPAAAVASSAATIALSGGFSAERTGLTISNTGDTVTVTVCGNNALDCSATATFGAWPKTLRGMIAGDDVDEYYLRDLQFRWGEDNSKGSEHQVCGTARAAELQMVFVNKRATVSGDRENEDSGTKLVVLSTLLGGGAAEDNAAFAPVLSAIASQAWLPGDAGRVGALQLAALLPADHASKYYTYAGGLTAPPCTQVVTWFTFETVVALSDAQLDLLRGTQTHLTGIELEHHAYKALLFPFFAILLGTATLHLLSRYAPMVPYTVAVLILGYAADFALSAFFYDAEGGDADPEDYGSLKQSFDMWASIDGHVLLFAFLPALLFGDAMSLNMHTFRQCFWQCVLLACPGVLFGAVATGVAAYYILPYGWNFLFCMCFGSILSATDPVAVVSMLKEVGASPRLTMQITGEALMNDGTAMVLFSLFWAMYNETDHALYRDAGAVLVFFCRMSIAGPLLGCALGYGAYAWMAQATRKHVESDVIIQTSITLCTAYLSFFLGESECLVSGVLCCIFAACVLAENVWPVVNSRESMENVWHAIEYFGNTVLFFLAGVITHRSITSSQDGGVTADVDFVASDYGYVFLFFVIMTGVRALMVLALYPLLARLGGGTSPEDAGFSVWAGLRGAVGLALAQLVLQSGGDQRAGKQLLFMVAGLALLTLLVQGATCGLVLEKLGMLGIPAVKEAMLKKVYERIEAHSAAAYEQACVAHGHDAKDALEHLTTLRKHREAKQSFREATAASPVDGGGGGDEETGSSGGASLAPLTVLGGHEPGGGGHCDAGGGFDFSVANLRRHVASWAAKGAQPDADVCSALRETYHGIVRAEYWEQIEAGLVPSSSRAALLLLESVDIALDKPGRPLHDLTVLMALMTGSLSSEVSKALERLLASVDRCLPYSATLDNELKYYVHFESLEVCYYCCSAFERAHTHAQRTLALHFGDAEGVPDSHEECLVLLESAVEAAKARKVVTALVEQEVVSIIKTKVVSEHLLEAEHAYVHRLIRSGVLTVKESEPMFAAILRDGASLEAQRKRQVQALTAAEMVKGARKAQFDLCLRNPDCVWAGELPRAAPDGWYSPGTPLSKANLDRAAAASRQGSLADDSTPAEAPRQALARSPRVSPAAGEAAGLASRPAGGVGFDVRVVKVEMAPLAPRASAPNASAAAGATTTLDAPAASRVLMAEMRGEPVGSAGEVIYAAPQIGAATL